jgi:pyruvate dehydrogenase E1 component alpha subunit
MDVAAVRDMTRKAVAHVRSGEGPMFVEFRTYRFRAHSMFDAELYRSRAEVDEWKQRDPIALLTARASDAGLALDVEAIEREVAAELQAAIAFAEAGTLEPVDDLATDVCAATAGASA